MEINKNYFTDRCNHMNSTVTWNVVGTTNCPSPDRLAVRRFTKKSVVFVDAETGEQYYAGLKIANKILMAQQGLYSGPFICVQKHSSDDRNITWIGEVVY